jgi:hypothetical protein
MSAFIQINYVLASFSEFGIIIILSLINIVINCVYFDL